MSAPSAPTAVPLRVHVLSSLHDVDAAAWDALAAHDNPFVSHAFLSLLEDSDSVGERAGWLPRHIAVFQGDTLVGGMPLYLRTNSYGEYIFDWGWAEAAPRFRVRYYPKLTSAVPFTPATGPRLLVRQEFDTDAAAAIRAALLAAARGVMTDERCSSLHVLYCEDDEARALTEAGMLRRASAQFHWRNDGYASFDDFLGRLRHEERKQMRRERRRVAEAGVHVEVLRGSDVPRALWPRIFALYTSTSDRKWGRPYLSPAFFDALPARLGDSAVVALARKSEELVAMTLSFERGRHLYGRYWGASEEIPGLHFELCYYALIDRAIERGLTLVEAGAQGEHKLKRGFLPVLTHSVHDVVDPRFRAAVDRFLAEEALALTEQRAELLAHGPFKEGAEPPLPLIAGLADL